MKKIILALSLFSLLIQFAHTQESYYPLSITEQIAQRKLIKINGIETIEILNSQNVKTEEFQFAKDGLATRQLLYKYGKFKYQKVFYYNTKGTLKRWALAYSSGNVYASRKYFYDEDGELTKSIYLPSNEYYLVDYNEHGNIATRKYYNENSKPTFTIIPTYDSQFRLEILETYDEYNSLQNKTQFIYGENGLPEKYIYSSYRNGREGSPKEYYYKYKGMPLTEKIKQTVESKINSWQKKGRYEKLDDYESRVTEETRNNLIDIYTQNVIDSLASSGYSWTIYNTVYDADNETMKIHFENFGEIYFKVPGNEVEDFDKNISKIKYNNPQFTIVDGFFGLNALDIKCKKHEYKYNRNDNLAFKTSDFNFNFEAVEIISQTSKVSNTKEVTIGKAETDINIPVSNCNKSNTYALIIGNEDYTTYQPGLSTESNVNFAVNDAEVFAQYCEKTLCIPTDNITLLKNAISSQIKQSLEKISKIAQYSNGNAEIIFYYAGHGFPHEQTKEAYLMPVDISGSFVEDGIKLSELYSKLTANPVKRITVFMDACFSGAGRNQGLLAVRGIKVKPKENPVTGDLIVFAASTGDQSALPYKAKQHGLFTYFLLKKLQESKGNVTYKELSEYVISNVQLTSVLLYSKDQNPNLMISPDFEGWETLKLR